SGQKRKLSIESKQLPEDNYSMPANSRKTIARVSQWGLKEAWLGQRPGSHNRWEHSVGAFDCGYIWLKWLEENGCVPQHCLKASAQCLNDKKSWTQIRQIVGTALLLHDYGHLPFAHLLEQVLASINWLPVGNGSNSGEILLLKERLDPGRIKSYWQELLRDFEPGQNITKPDDIYKSVFSLISGKHGVPWLQVIVNSPIDADKIDYVRFDSRFLQDTSHSVKSRLQINVEQWLNEFLFDQRVNHAGLLCLSGRSAIAAADLWRERIFLYDRFYLSSDLRVPESIVFEILLQFAIHSTMNSDFRHQVIHGGEGTLDGYIDLISNQSNPNIGINTIEAKRRAICNAMEYFDPKLTSEEKELEALRIMHRSLQSSEYIDSLYKSFLEASYNTLVELYPNLEENKLKRPPQRSLREIVSKCLVNEPIVFNSRFFSRARELLRPLQHAYCTEVIIDLIRLPRVLAAPSRWKSSIMETSQNEIDYSILVPEGPIHTWGVGSIAKVPLSDASVKSIERPICRIVVVSPFGGRRQQCKFIWDRIRSTLLEGDIPILKQGGIN
ncbi:MAG TPA: hypothetical protein VHP63_01725, partial [candidate division Zixibacteria bacterium]|nr:hypothetical protein [candidate division Zixibacteria bacterium]